MQLGGVAGLTALTMEVEKKNKAKDKKDKS
jgi:hypothetical protein